MSMLDAHIPQLVASQSAFGAMSAQAFHAGESAAAFQAAHARFVAAAAPLTCQYRLPTLGVVRGHGVVLNAVVKL